MMNFKTLLEDAITNPSNEIDFSTVEDTPSVTAMNKPTDLAVANGEEVLEPQQPKTVRILTIDKSKCNRELKELSDQTDHQAIPIKRVKDIIAKYNVVLVDENYKFLGRSGNADLELKTTKGIPVSNSALVIYWNRVDNFINIYLS
jgi:hypothetical protein